MISPIAFVSTLVGSVSVDGKLVRPLPSSCDQVAFIFKLMFGFESADSERFMPPLSRCNKTTGLCIGGC